MMNENPDTQTPVEIPAELLISFAKFLAPELVKFYQSAEGKAYFEQWEKQHPEPPPPT